MKLSLDAIPKISRDGMKRIDSIMVEDIGISIKMMMENNAKALAVICKETLDEVMGTNVLVVAGKGHNGGGGLATARHLSSWGFDVKVVLSRSVNDLKLVTEDQYMILKKLSIEVVEYEEDRLRAEELIDDASVILDALLGYSIVGSAIGNELELINLINDSQGFIVSNDLPSGMDPDKLYKDSPKINADKTVTISLPKKSFVDKEAEESLGKLYVCDITVPRSVYEQLDIQIPNLFYEGFVVEVDQR